MWDDAVATAGRDYIVALNNRFLAERELDELRAARARLEQEESRILNALAELQKVEQDAWYTMSQALKGTHPAPTEVS